MTTAQALAAGLTPRHLRTLVANGWRHPARGVFIAPDAYDPFVLLSWPRCWSALMELSAA